MKRRWLALSLSLGALPACTGSSTEFWLPQNDLLPMVPLASRVAYVERSSATVFVLDPADPSLMPRLASVGKRPIGAAKHNGSDRLLVVSAGDRGSVVKAPVPATLSIVDPSLLDTQGPPPESASTPLTDRFDGLAQSEDGSFAVLYHASTAQDASDGTLFNPNGMMVLDFSANPAGMPTATAKSIRSWGGVPSTSNSSVSPIQFSPVYSFQGIPRRLAVVLSQNYVTLFDLTYLSHEEISVPLCPASGTCNYSVDQVVFDPSNFGDPTRPNINIYVRSSGAKDIYQITLTPPTDPTSAGATTGGNNFVASVSMLAVGASPTDMALYGVGVNARLAVVAPDARNLVIIDPNTGRSVPVSMQIPATNIVPFTTPSLDPSQPRNRAMLVDLQRGSTSVLFADIGAAESAGGSSLDQFSIRGAPTQVVPILAQGIAVLLFGKSYGNAVLSVVTLTDTPSFFDFNSSSVLGSPYLDVRGLATRVWCVDSPENGLPSPSSGIHFQDLVPAGSQLPATIWLDQTITSITALAQPSSDGHRYLALEQADPDVRGNLTFLDADHPDRTTARTSYGFLFASYLGRTEP